MKKGTLFSIQYLRGIAATLVALYHFEPQVNIVLASKHIELDFLRYFGYLGVDLFFIISGFVIWLTTYKINQNCDQKDRIKTFLAKRCFRIYSLYLSVLLLLLLAMAVLGFHKLAGIGPIDLIKIFTLFPYPVDKHPLPIAWTLSYEMIFYLSFAFLLCVKNGTQRLRIIFSYFLILLVISGYLALAKGIEFHEITLWANNISWPYIDLFALTHLISPLLLEFCMGIFVAHFYLKFQPTHPIKIYLPLLRWGALVLIAMSYGGLSLYKIDLNYHAFARAVLIGTLFSLLIYTLVCHEQIKTIKKPNQLLLTLGDASYSIYLLHTIFYGFFKYQTNFLQKMSSFGWFGVFIMYIVFFLIITISVFYSKLVELPSYLWLIKKQYQKNLN